MNNFLQATPDFFESLIHAPAKWFPEHRIGDLDMETRRMALTPLLDMILRSANMRHAEEPSDEECEVYDFLFHGFAGLLPDKKPEEVTLGEMSDCLQKIADGLNDCAANPVDALSEGGVLSGGDALDTELCSTMAQLLRVELVGNWTRIMLLYKTPHQTLRTLYGMPPDAARPEGSA